MKAAFSLVELSIVLVILGLLTGGILAGQNLIRAAELRSVVTEYQRYTTAANTFRDKYFAVPGDMQNAEDFWGTMSTGTCPNATAGVGTETCNGDGDGFLGNAGAASQFSEELAVWQHLANAGLIEGTYTGISGSGSTFDGDIGVNVPRSKVSNAGWYTASFGAGTIAAGTATLYANIPYGRMLMFGAESATEETDDALLTPEEAWNIDSKVDDGKPARGRVIARYWDDACASADVGVSSNSNHDASYRLSDDSIQCSLYFTQSM